MQKGPVSRDLVHPPYETVDEEFTVSMVTTFYEVPGLLTHPSSCTTELERPQKVVYLLEMWTNCEDLMD